MKDYLRSLLPDAQPATHRRNLAREYLQARILGALQRAGAMVPLAFHGGTALRFLHGLPRWSEDLDFALERAEGAYDFRRLLAVVVQELGREGYRVDAKVSDKRTVHAAYLRFPGLPHELGFSARRDEVLAIKLEVDTRPPAGATLETTVVRRYAILNLQHHDRASLLAGKLHAVLQRPYPKGRDMFDLLWYLTDRDWPEPNLVMLRNALRQTGYSGQPPSPKTWRKTVARRLDTLDWTNVDSDVAPFLDPSVGPGLLTADNLKRALAAHRPGVARSL